MRRCDIHATNCICGKFPSFFHVEDESGEITGSFIECKDCQIYTYDDEHVCKAKIVQEVNMVDAIEYWNDLITWLRENT